MKISYKIYFLIIIVFIKNSIIHCNNQLVFQGNKQVVSMAIAEITNLGLDSALYEALLSDMEAIISQVSVILNQIKKKASTLIDHKDNLDEMIFDYRSAAVSFNKFKEFNLLSKETQTNILGSVLFGIGNMLTQKTKMEKLLNNEQFSTLLFFMTAMGIEFSCLKVLEKITISINKNCLHLKTNDLDNYVYEATIYDIYNILAQKIINNELSNVLIDRILSFALNTMKEDITILKNKSSKEIKKSKNKK